MTILSQITDLHIDNDVPELKHLDSRAQALAVLDDLQRQNIEQLVITGDIAETRSGVDWFLDQLDQRGFKYRLILGNHDLTQPYVEKKLLGNPQFYYALELEGFLVLFLDSANNHVDQAQLAWLDEQLFRAEREVLIFIHHPVLDCGGTLMDQKYPLKNRDEVLQILLKTNRKLALFCGHYHMEAVIEQGKLTQYVTPSTFYQLKKYSGRPEMDSEIPGYRILSLEDGKYTTEVKYLA